MGAHLYCQRMENGELEMENVVSSIRNPAVVIDERK
jgi:hypothetical protein